MRAFGPDSFNSWLVSMACSGMFFMQYGMNRIAGLLFVSTMDTFHVGRETASMPYTLGMTTRYITGPLSGYLAGRLGMRFVILFGTTLCAVGVGCCCFATNIITLAVLWGGFYGVGCGLATSVLPQMVNLHFEKHYSKAYGIAIAGSSLAGFVLPPIVEILLQNYDLSGTFLILSGLVLNCFPAAIVMRKPPLLPGYKSNNLKTNLKSRDEKCKDCKNDMATMSVPVTNDGIVDTKDYHFNKTSSLTIPEIIICKDDCELKKLDSNGVYVKDSNNFCKNSCSEKEDSSKIDHNSDIPYIDNAKDYSTYSNSEKDKLSESIDPLLQNKPLTKDTCICKDTITSTLLPQPSSITNQKPSKKLRNHFSDFSIFWDPVFLFITTVESISTILYIVVPTVIVDFGRDKGIPVSDATYLMMCFAFCDMFSNVAFGFVTDGKYLTKSFFCAMCLAVASVALVLLTFTFRFVTTLLCVIVAGMSIGAATPLFPGIITDYIEKEKQTMAIASIGIFFVPLNLCTSPTIGYFRDFHGSYNGLMYCLAVISLFCCGLFLLLPKVSDWKINLQKKQQNKQISILT